MSVSLPPLDQVGLAVDAVGAMLVLLPELPYVGSKLTDYGRVGALEDVADELFRRIDGGHGGLVHDVGEDDPVRGMVVSRAGFPPTEIDYHVDPDAETHHLDIHRVSGSTYTLAEPSQFVEWVRSEQDRLRGKRKGLFLALGAALIGIGFGLQLVAA